MGRKSRQKKIVEAALLILFILYAYLSFYYFGTFDPREWKLKDDSVNALIGAIGKVIVQAGGGDGTTVATPLKVYSDSLATTELQSIDWGTLSPGETVTKTIYLENVGTTSLVLSLNTTNWVPSIAENYLALTWNYGSSQVSISPNAILPATLQLSVASNIQGITDFSFTIVVVCSSQ